MMKILQLSPEIGNLQTGYLPGSLLEADIEDGNSADIEKYVAVTLPSHKRRILLRSAAILLPGEPEDVPQVIRCDLRVQQIIPRWNGTGREMEGATSGGRLAKQEVSSSNQEEGSQGKHPNHHHPAGGGMELKSGSNPEMEGMEESMEEHGIRSECSRNQETDDEDDMEGISHETPRPGKLSRRSGWSWNDYSEIDLAHHVTSMEHMMSRGGGDAAAAAPPTSEGMAGGNEYLSLEQLPSTMRSNDVLACTSKDIQILKSGAIKMMRLTVICHSDLHYQNHSQKHQHAPVKSCFGNGGTTAKETVPLTEPPSSSTPKVYSSTSSSSMQMEVSERKEVGEYEKGRSSPTTSQTSGPEHHQHRDHHHHEMGRKKSENIQKHTSSSTHHHSNHEEHRFTSTIHHPDQREVGKPSSLSSSAASASASTTSKNWECLKEKIRSVFQAYNIHVGEGTLVSLKGCPLSSLPTKFSPAVRFVFVEECEMRTTPQSQQPPQPDIMIGRVTGRTEIFITNVHHISHYHRMLEKASGPGLHLYGLETAAKILNSVIEIQPRKEQQGSANVSSNGLTEFSHGLLISGPSGCGKVAVVREIGKKVGAHLLSFNPVGSVEQNVSQFCQQLTKIFMSALMTASRYPTVLLLPRIHLLFQRSNSPSSSAHNFPSSSLQTSRERVLHHLCKLFDSIPGGLALTVVGTTDKAFLVPLQLRRAGRLEKEVIISPPMESDRLNILRELCRELAQFRNVDLEEVATQTPGYVAQDLKKLVQLALFKCQEEDSSHVSELHVRYSIGRVVPSVLEGALGVVDIQRAISLDHIAGLHSVKLDLIKAIVWPLKHPQSFLRMGISPPKGILLYGPPGNCKTTLVRAVAASHQTNFLSVSAAELFSSGVGDSEKIVSHLFHRARMASPCILFIDELEAIVGSRQNSEKKQTSTNESILSMLLTEMDGVGSSKIGGVGITAKSYDGISGVETPSLGPLVLVVAATNRPDLIDPALLRPGRFDKLIGVPPLDETGRMELLEFCSKSIPFHSDVDFSGMARATENYSGADLVNLCKEAAMYALSEDMSAPFVANSHVNQALSMVGPSLNSEMVRAFHEYGSSRRCC